EAMPDPVLRVDGKQRILEANQAAIRLVGRQEREVIGQSLIDVFDPRAKDGTPILRDGWHPSARLRGVTRIPESEVTIAAAGGDVVARVTGRYERNGDGHVEGAILVVRPPQRRADNEPTGAEVV